MMFSDGALVWGIVVSALVSMNAYNGSLLSGWGAEFGNGYSIASFELAFVIASLFLISGAFENFDLIEWAGAVSAFAMLLQWMVHSPFQAWPSWMTTRTKDDSRHRTEYYDTVVLVFVLYFGLLLRRHPGRGYAPLKSSIAF